MSLDQQFEEVSNKVRNWSKKPSDVENLALYSLYKQATVGDVNIPEPSGPVAVAKWTAWRGRHGLSKEEAKQKYIDTANTLHAKYA